MKFLSRFLEYFGFGVLLVASSGSASFAGSYSRIFGSDLPISDLLETPEGLDAEFCQEWNPEFAFHGFKCCAPDRRGRGRRGRGARGASCAPTRKVKWQYCDEMTESQRLYSQRVQSGEIPDVLGFLEKEIQLNRQQSVCSVNTGFLAWGRRVIPTSQNRIQLSNPNRCVDFGTDEMAAMLEWVGRKISKEFPAPEFSETKLLLGDLSAPRGGCISGRGGRRGHSSHTSGLDADVAFLSVTTNAGRAPAHFHRGFDAASNWWLLKQFFKNPYACVRVVFADKKNIQKLQKVARNDPDWAQFGSHLKHLKGHRNHFHVRVAAPGTGKCSSILDPEEEAEEGGDTADSGEGVSTI